MALLDVRDALILASAAIVVSGLAMLGRWIERARHAQILDELRAALNDLRAHAHHEERTTGDLDERNRAAYRLLRRLARKFGLSVEDDDEDRIG